jgi:hypothetical protein
MEKKDRNSCYEAFSRLCEEETANELASSDEFQYWMFERGYRAAVQGLLEILETKEQRVKYVSPKLQALADKLLTH